jgi:hypothetical protein
MSQHNTIFPFLTNSSLYAISAVLDAIGATMCFKFRDKDVADYAILSFILLMSWYTFGMYLTNPGGYSCGCLGILTVLFHLTWSQEKVAADAILAILFA